MKMNLLIIMTLIVIFGCDKDNQNTPLNKNDIMGVWLNLSNVVDTVKITESKIERIDTIQKQFLHNYSYTIDNKSIILKYTGLDEILVEPYEIKVTLNKSKSEVTFQGLSNYHPKYSGETFKKIK